MDPATLYMLVMVNGHLAIQPGCLPHFRCIAEPELRLVLTSMLRKAMIRAAATEQAFHNDSALMPSR